MISEKQLADFTRGYTAALLWSSVVENRFGGDDNADEYPLSTAGADKCAADCRAFCNAHADLILRAVAVPGYSFEKGRARFRVNP